MRHMNQASAPVDRPFPDADATSAEVEAFALAGALSNLIGARGVAFAAIAAGEKIELRYPTSPKAQRLAAVVVGLWHARRMVVRARWLTPGPVSKWWVIEQVVINTLKEAPTTHHFAPWLRVQVVAESSRYLNRRGNISGSPRFGGNCWRVYLDSPPGTSNPAKGRKRTCIHFREEELRLIDEPARDADRKASEPRDLHGRDGVRAWLAGWGDGASDRPAERPPDPQCAVTTVYIKAYAEGQRARAAESEKAEERFGFIVPLDPNA